MKEFFQKYKGAIIKLLMVLVACIVVSFIALLILFLFKIVYFEWKMQISFNPVFLFLFFYGRIDDRKEKGGSALRFSGFSELLRHYAARTPQAPALKIEANGAVREIGYAALCAQIDARAAALAQTGKTCLGVLCDGSCACVVEIFAAVQAGLQAVLLNENADADLVAAAEIDLLWGDPSKAERVLGWKRKVDFKGLVRMMVRADMEKYGN